MAFAAGKEDVKEGRQGVADRRERASLTELPGGEEKRRRGGVRATL